MDKLLKFEVTESAKQSCDYNWRNNKMYNRALRLAVKELGISTNNARFIIDNQLDNHVQVLYSINGKPNGNYAIVMEESLEGSEIFELVFHEARHLWQFQTGRAKDTGQNGVLLWDGVPYKMTHPLMIKNGEFLYENDPWEVDANQWADEMMKKYNITEDKCN